MADMETRFWSYVDRSGGPLACWPWTGARAPKGYGNFNGGGGSWTHAHRLAHELATGMRPAPGLVVMHSCDNPPCCNPAHLTAGTPAQNSQDMKAKGRSPRLRNERSGKAKLTDVQVAEIRARRLAGEQCKDIAVDFGVHPAHVSRVVRFLRRPADSP